MIQVPARLLHFFLPPFALAATLALSACATSNPQSSAMNAETAAALGVGEEEVVGATSGVVPDETPSKKKKGDEYKASVKEQEQFMKDQAAAMQKQQDELDDLRRQRYHDGYLRQRYDVDEDGTID